MSGLYTDDKLGQADRDQDPPPVVHIAPDHTKPQTSHEGPVRPWCTFKEMINEFAKLRGRLAPEESTYYQTLTEFGVEHSNEFQDAGKAAAAYQKLLSRVREYEVAQKSTEESAMMDAAELLEEIKPPDEGGIS